MSVRFRIVTGKGGVGKTTVAAAMALAATEAGQRVLLCEVRAHDRVAALLEVAPVGPKMREVRPGLFVVDMYPEDALHEYVLLTVRFEALYRAVFENRLVHAFLRLVPALPELVLLGKIWFHEREREKSGRPRFDLIVLDAPATGHAKSLLRTPETVMAAMPAGPVRDHARDMHTLLTDPTRTALHIVTTPEEMPVNEALELERFARELGVGLGAAFLNQDVEPLPSAVLAQLAPLACDPALAGALVALRQREHKREAGASHFAHLPPQMLERAVRLPLLVSSQFALGELHALRVLLSAAVST